MVNTKIRLLYSLHPKMEMLHTVSKKKTRTWLWIRSWTSYCKFWLKLKKVGKTTWPFRYNLNQIPCDYTMQVTNRFKGLDLIECLQTYGWRSITLYRRRWSKPSPKRRNEKRQMVVWGGLTNSWEKKWSERQRRKGKINPSECRVPKNSKGEIRKPSSVISAKK